MKMPGSREAAEACGPRMENGSGCSPRMMSSISAAVMPDALSGVSAIPGWSRVLSVILPSYGSFYWNASADANCASETFYVANGGMRHEEFSCGGAGQERRAKVG